MNFDRLVRMVTRMFLRKAVSRGVNAGFKVAKSASTAETKQQKRKLTPEERAARTQKRAAKKQARQVRQATRMARRMTKL